MRKYIVNEMVCDNKADLHKMRAPAAFDSLDDARKYVKDRTASEYVQAKGYDVDEVREWMNREGTLITTIYYTGGFSEFYIHSIEV